MVGPAAHSFFIARFSEQLIRLELFFLPRPRVNDKFGSVGRCTARAQPVHRGIGARAGKTRVAPSVEAASGRNNAHGERHGTLCYLVSH